MGGLEDSQGNTVEFDTSNSVTLRAGFAYDFDTSETFAATAGSKSYLIGNLLQEHVSSFC